MSADISITPHIANISRISNAANITSIDNVDMCGRAGGRKLRQLRTKLVRRILWAPLFDVAAWVNDMEVSLRLIWETYLARGAQGAGESEGASPRTMHTRAVRPAAAF